MVRALAALQVLFFLFSSAAFGGVPLKMGTFVNRSGVKIIHIEEFLKTELMSQLTSIERFNFDSTNSWLLDGVIIRLNVNAGGLSSFGIGGYHYLDTSADVELKASRSGTSLKIRDHAQNRETDTELIVKNKTRTESIRDTADRLLQMDALSPEFRESIFGRTMLDLTGNLVWKLSLAVLGQSFGYKTDIADARNGFVIIKNNPEAQFKVGQEFFIRSAVYSSGSLSEKKSAKIKALMSDKIEITVPDHFFKSGDKVFLY
jgi:hypothetical protein